MEDEEKKLFIEEIMDSEEAPVVKSQACAKINWGECSEPDDAIEKARNGINSDITQFESENASIEAIAKIAKLSNDEKEIFTKMSLGHDNDINETVKKEIKRKIKDVFEKPENIVEALRYIHDTWCRNHGDNFQKIKDDGTKRDRDYQFTDLLLMSFDNDGAFADLMFIRPMLEFCGVEYNEPKIKEAFSKKRKEFLKENGITNRDALKDFIKKGSKSYDALTELQGFNNIPIDTYLKDDEILERMINQVMENARLEEVFKTLNEEEHELEGGMQGAVTVSKLTSSSNLNMIPRQKGIFQTYRALYNYYREKEIGIPTQEHFESLENEHPFISKIAKYFGSRKGKQEKASGKYENYDDNKKTQINEMREDFHKKIDLRDKGIDIDIDEKFKPYIDIDEKFEPYEKMGMSRAAYYEALKRGAAVRKEGDNSNNYVNKAEKVTGDGENGQGDEGR